jgi:hypothetical protein
MIEHNVEKKRKEYCSTRNSQLPTNWHFLFKFIIAIIRLVQYKL